MKTRKTKRTVEKRGIVLPLVITIAVCLAIIGIGLLQVGLGTRVMAVRTTSEISARAAADAGITRALYEMNRRFSPDVAWDNSWIPYGGAGDLSNSASGNATFTYDINGVFGNHHIVSRGTAGAVSQIRKTLHADVRVVTKFDYAIIVQDRIDLYPGSVVGGYNSADPTDPFTYVKIGTNSILPDMIWLRPDCFVDGDVLVGFNGDVETVIEARPGATTGPRYPLPQPVPLLKTPVPYNLPPGQPITYDANGFAIITQSGVYSNIEVPQGSVLQVGDGINQVVDVVLYVQGDLWLRQGAELRVTGTPGIPTTWSALTIYLDGELDGGNSNGINNMTLKPGQFKLVGTGPEGVDWLIRNGGDFYGVYDAPNANIEIKESGDIYGAVVGKSFEQKAKCNIFYDEDLSQPYSGPVGFAISRWWEE
ncbi:MAG TPA: hypothetical protein VMX13_17885 [Sedimentisphaerales bacterium]|nr:hypothetical protein [Sedimentisphaerales bacterium]